MIYYTQGDLLQSDAEALVNTINCVGTMGKGIALSFKKKFPDNFLAYKEGCNRKEIYPGKMFVYSLDSLFGTKYIINFPTKNHWRSKSRLSYIETGLQDLVHVIKTLGIQSIAIPPLGCGNGGLSWKTVKNLIVTYLKDIPCDIFVYEPPKAFLGFQENTLTSSRALLLTTMEEYSLQSTEEVNWLEIQKIAYFLQILGEPLRLRFEVDHYGPFADKLKLVLKDLEQKEYIQDISYSDLPNIHKIRMMLNKVEEAQQVIKNDSERMERLHRFKNLVDGFESTYGMILLATVHWIIRNRLSGKYDLEEIVHYIKEKNNQGRHVFTPYHIKVAHDRLRDSGIIC